MKITSDRTSLAAPITTIQGRPNLQQAFGGNAGKGNGASATPSDGRAARVVNATSGAPLPRGSLLDIVA